MARKRRKQKRETRYRGGYVVVNGGREYRGRENISRGILVAWAEWIPTKGEQHDQNHMETSRGTRN